MFRYHWRCDNLGWWRMWTNLWTITLLWTTGEHIWGCWNVECAQNCERVFCVWSLFASYLCERVLCFYFLFARACTYLELFKTSPTNLLNCERVLCATLALAWSWGTHLTKGLLLCGTNNQFYFYKSVIFSLQNIHLRSNLKWGRAEVGEMVQIGKSGGNLKCSRG